MRLIGNVIWFLFGGALMGLGWWLVGVLACPHHRRDPWAKACFGDRAAVVFPFGRMAVKPTRAGAGGRLGHGALGVLGNVVWFVFAGLCWRWDTWDGRCCVSCRSSASRLVCST